MRENRQHMVPQVIIDCAENLMNSKIEHMRDSYIMRLETIRDYCDEVLKKSNNPARQIFDKKSKTKLNYVRTSRNNV